MKHRKAVERIKRLIQDTYERLYPTPKYFHDGVFLYSCDQGTNNLKKVELLVEFVEPVNKISGAGPEFVIYFDAVINGRQVTVWPLAFHEWAEEELQEESV
jgi:hypothetical protein